MLLFKLLILFLQFGQAEEFRIFDSYTEQRNFFLKQTQANTNSDSWTMQIESIETPNLLTEEKLFTDFVWLRQKSTSSSEKKIVVVSSGIHGIEGYVGSAMQSQILSGFLSQQKGPEHDFLFVHTINPWGMNFKRRVNSNNVDLNRSFDFSSELFRTENKSYTEIYDFLNPQRPFENSYWHRPLFVLDSIFLILKSSMKTMRQAVLQGQYQHPKGLYFGGQERQVEAQRMMALAGELNKKYEKIFWIDLHTGYGRRGVLHLLADSDPTQNLSRLHKIFDPSQIDQSNKNDFYKTSGDMIGFLTKSYPEKLTAVVFEYGTLDSQKTLGSIESLRRMVVENQVFFQNRKAQATNTSFDQIDFIEMFRPSDLNWQKSVVSQTDSALA